MRIMKKKIFEFQFSKKKHTLVLFWNLYLKDAYKFLLSNLPSWDSTNKASLGFHNDDGDVGVDGLDNGIATLGINISLEAKQKYFWASNVSEEIYHEFVITYANVNEAR